MRAIRLSKFKLRFDCGIHQDKASVQLPQKSDKLLSTHYSHQYEGQLGSPIYPKVNI